MREVLFIHGGPGLNSEPEKRLLSSHLKEFKTHFWNEPSELRGQKISTNAYQDWLNSIKKMQPENSILIANSFGSLGALHLIEQEIKLKKIVFLSPTIQLHQVFLKMIELAIFDFQKRNDDKANEIQKLKNTISSFYDSSMQKALDLTFQDPDLFPHYWQNYKILGEWGAILGEQEFQFDFQSQKAVLNNLKDKFTELPSLKSNARVTVIYGENDPVWLDSNISLFQSMFKDIKFHKFEDCGHFPHLENKELFIKVIEQDF